MATFKEKKVSKAWQRVLRSADKDINFRVNSGRRSLAEQWRLFRQNMYGIGRPRPGRPYTAFPSPTAPHIRVGLPNHALDVDTYYGDGEAALQRWLEKRGVRVSNPVSGEPWHLEVPLRDLLRLTRKIKRRRRRRRRRRRNR